MRTRQRSAHRSCGSTPRRCWRTAGADQAAPRGDDPGAGAKPVRASITVAPDTLAEVLFTSGTTSDPKGVMLTHGQMIHNARTIAVTAGIRRERALALIPLSHMYGQIVPLLYGMVTNSQLTFLPALTPSALMAAMRRDRVTVITAVPAAAASSSWTGSRPRRPARATRSAAPGPPDRPRPADAPAPAPLPLGPRSLRRGAPDDHLRRRRPCRPTSSSAWEALGIVVVQGYGATECATIAGHTRTARRPGTVGPPLAGMEVRLGSRRRAHRPGAQRHARLLGQARADRRGHRRRLGTFRRRRRDRPPWRPHRPRPHPGPDRPAERSEGLPRGRRGGDRRGRLRPGRRGLRGEPGSTRRGPPAGRSRCGGRRPRRRGRAREPRALAPPAGATLGPLAGPRAAADAHPQGSPGRGAGLVLGRCRHHRVARRHRRPRRPTSGRAPERPDGGAGPGRRSGSSPTADGSRVVPSSAEAVLPTLIDLVAHVVEARWAPSSPDRGRRPPSRPSASTRSAGSGWRSRSRIVFGSSLDDSDIAGAEDIAGLAHVIVARRDAAPPPEPPRWAHDSAGEDGPALARPACRPARSSR